MYRSSYAVSKNKLPEAEVAWEADEDSASFISDLVHELGFNTSDDEDGHDHDYFSEEEEKSDHESFDEVDANSNHDSFVEDEDEEDKDSENHDSLREDDEEELQ